MNKKTIILLVIIIVVFGFFYFRSRSKKDTDTFTVKKGLVKEELVLTGIVKAERHVKLSFSTSGKISWIGVTEGQKVYRGQALTSLDKTVLNSVYQQSLNNYRNYQAAAENTLDSVKNHSSDETFAQKATRTASEVARDNAYDSMVAAKYNLNNATLLSPFAGVISSLPFPNVGVNVSLADVIVEIVDPSTVYFEVDADQNEVTNLNTDQEVRIILDAFEDASINGKVTFVGLTPKVGEAGTIYAVKVKFTSEKNIRVGMTGDARFILSQKDNVLYVPIQFVNSDSQGKYVYLGKKGNRVNIETGIEGEDVIEVISGVSEGDVLYD